jgi:hypothetical protein
MKSGSIRKSIRKCIPRAIKNLLMDSGEVKPEFDGYISAFRVYIIMRKHQILGGAL